MRHVIVIAFAALILTFQNCSDNSAKQINTDSRGGNNNPPGGLSGEFLGQDIGTISRLRYSQSGGLIGITSSLAIYMDQNPPYVWGSRVNPHSTSPVMCMQVMHNLTGAEVAGLIAGMEAAQLKTIPGSNVVVADCPETTLEITFLNGESLTYKFDAGSCNAFRTATQVIEDLGGLASHIDSLISKYGCNDPVN